MLRPIPARILRSTATVDVCTGVNMYQVQTYQTYNVSHVHLQPTAAVRKTPTNTDRQLRSVLFVDARLSTPALDWAALFEQAHALGGDVRVTVRGVEYTVANVDELRDDTDALHQWEIGLI